MAELERRDKLAQPQDEHDGECFIAYRHGDKVHTLSGMADSFNMDADMDSVLDWYGDRRLQLNLGHTVTIHFYGKVIEEVRPFGGEG